MECVTKFAIRKRIKMRRLRTAAVKSWNYLSLKFNILIGFCMPGGIQTNAHFFFSQFLFPIQTLVISKTVVSRFSIWDSHVSGSDALVICVSGVTPDSPATFGRMGWTLAVCFLNLHVKSVFHLGNFVDRKVKCDLISQLFLTPTQISN